MPELQVAVATGEPSAYTVISSPLAGQEPVKSGVLSLVMLSVFEVPLSVAAVRSGVPGALEAVASIVTDRLGLAALWLPATSVAVIVIE